MQLFDVSHAPSVPLSWQEPRRLQHTLSETNEVDILTSLQLHRATPISDACCLEVSFGLSCTMAPASPDGESAGTRAFTDVQTQQTGSTPEASAKPEVSDLELRLGRPSLKRKEVESSGNRFKIVSQLVIAMKRFQGDGVTCSCLLLLGHHAVSSCILCPYTCRA